MNKLKILGFIFTVLSFVIGLFQSKVEEKVLYETVNKIVEERLNKCYQATRDI